MKRFMIFAALAALLFASCAKINDITVTDNQKAPSEIVFNLGKNSVTKAVVTGTTMTQDFRVYGYVKDQTDVEATSGRYLVKDARYLSTGAPADGKKYYWPAYSDFKVNFNAYSPSTLSHEWSNDVLTIHVDASAKDDDCVDVLIAKNLNVAPERRDSTITDPKTVRVDTVQLQFRHALAYIMFQAKQEDNDAIKEVQINSISFNDALNTAADLIINTGDVWSQTWDNVGTPDTVNNFADDATLTTDYRKLSEILTVPQDVPASVTINYDITIQNETGDRIVYKNRQITRTINAGSDANGKSYITAYESGKLYLYRINITVDELEFSVSVDDWSENLDWWQLWDHDADTSVEYFF